jgi:uncharacterized protein
MIDRNMYNIIFSEDWGRQMRFIVGPRQAGKTTLAKFKLKNEQSDELYYLWDLRSVKDRYRDNELFFTADSIPDSKKKKWICFDEIHKYPEWKNILKAVFDQTQDYYNFIITGSAKLNLIKKVGDSLAGRYFTFHLYPLVLSEICDSTQQVKVPKNAENFIFSGLEKSDNNNDSINCLLEYNGFPEPFLSQNKRFLRKWQNDYIEAVIKEDIAVLTKVAEREKIFDLYNILPEMVGSIISESSLASHIHASSPTINNYLKKLEDFYLAFSINPYSKNIKRSLLRARKYYLFDWGKVLDSGARFENFLACELKARTSLWNDATGENYKLFYVRDKQKKETDFLIVKGTTPWLLIESKLSDGTINRHHYDTSKALGDIPMVQVCLQSGIACMQSKNIFRISAGKLFV